MLPRVEAMHDRRNAAGAWLASRILHPVVALLLGTCRYRVVDSRRLEALLADGGPVVFATWHEGLFLLLGCFPRHVLARGMPLSVLVSRSRDGDLGAYLAVKVGARVVRGSTSRGGGPALRRLVREVQEGRSPVLIPDGPKGPAHEAKPGVVALARLAGVPLVPVGLAVDRAWRLGSWDRTRVPRPGARIVMALGEPWVGSGAAPASPEADSKELAKRLDRAGSVARNALAAGD
jgi:hypothetical protein